MIVFCQEGYTSSLAAAALQDLGLHRATDLAGGFEAWKRAGLPVAGSVKTGGVKLKLDLHDIFNRSGDIDRALKGIIDEAVAKRATLVEIIPGKGSGAAQEAGPAVPGPA